MSLLRILLLIGLSIDFARAACPPGDCQPYGDCVLEDTPECRENGSCEEQCVCRDGFSGSDCSFLMERCPIDDGTSEPDSHAACYNGGSCYPEPHIDTYSWRCDCSVAGFGDAVSLQGHKQCEFKEESFVSCEIDKEKSDYAFCVNGGSCGRNMVTSGERFHGCTCPTFFEGRHCQFPAGSALDRDFLTSSSETEKRGGIGAGTIVAIVLVVLVGMAGLVQYVIVARRRRNEDSDSGQKSVGTHVSDDGQLQLEDIDIDNDQVPAVTREII
ncbi:hypothetical protein MPSEU_000944300 [Mayamaea pseudoterrestris]|nr:hypothetical protein MPSEU_000944300 [Mayamaea pseudoterrestris]